MNLIYINGTNLLEIWCKDIITLCTRYEIIKISLVKLFWSEPFGIELFQNFLLGMRFVKEIRNYNNLIDKNYNQNDVFNAKRIFMKIDTEIKNIILAMYNPNGYICY